VCTLREPGGTPLGERIRALLLVKDMSMEAELFLYMASRAQLVARRIAPALEAGAWVVCDRFLYSSVAYQGAALGTEPVWAMGRVAVNGAQPDLAVFLDVDPAVAFRRGSRRRDRIERRSLSYHRAVRNGFLKAARRVGRSAVVIDATTSPDTVTDRVWDAVRRRLRP
jgi:dTMP kinase